MTKSILSPEQRRFLELFATNEKLSNHFYFTGGTALCEFYIPYRYSEDLDFFSETEVDVEPITVFLKSAKTDLGFNELEFNTSFNRNLFFLTFDEKTTLKLEFTYFPFPQIEAPKIINGLKVDGVLDIAANKLFTIYQNPRSRDFIDLFKINQKFGYEMPELIKKAKAKFDWHIDAIKLGAQFLEARALKDYPHLFEPIDHSTWQKYFEAEAETLKSAIFKS